MNETPPPILVETWIHLIAYGNEHVKHRKFEMVKAIKEHFGTLELAKSYVKQSKVNDADIYYL